MPDIADQRTVALRAWAPGDGATLAITLIELAILRPGAAAVVAVACYGLAVAVFAPMQFIFRNRVPDVPYEALAVQRLSRAGLGVTVVAAVAMIVLAAIGGVRLG